MPAGGVAEQRGRPGPGPRPRAWRRRCRRPRSARPGSRRPAACCLPAVDLHQRVEERVGGVVHVGLQLAPAVPQPCDGRCCSTPTESRSPVAAARGWSACSPADRPPARGPRRGRAAAAELRHGADHRRGDRTPGRCRSRSRRPCSCADGEVRLDGAPQRPEPDETRRAPTTAIDGDSDRQAGAARRAIGRLRRWRAARRSARCRCPGAGAPRARR